MTVLFVDDEPQSLHDLEQLISDAMVEWNCDFAMSGDEAIARLAEQRFDAVVTDLRMPGMDGAALLNYVGAHYPDVVRIAWSQQSDRDSVLRSVHSMHQFLPKPCDAATLRTTVNRACSLRDLLASNSLKRLVGGLSRLPSVPSVYRELTHELRNEDAAISTIGEIVAKDAAMTAKVLQLVNSAIFCLRTNVSDPIKAVSLLGASTLKSLVLAIGIFQEFEQLGARGFSADSLMHHCLRVSRVAKQIAKSEHLDEDSLEDAITAATLHDIGKLVLHAIDPQTCQEVRRMTELDGVKSWQAERSVFGADHAAVGAYLLSIWGLPQSIVEIVALHHTPTKACEMSFSPLTAVVSANFLCHASTHPPLPTPDTEMLRYLEMVACGARLPEWHNLIGESTRAAERANATPLPQDVSL